MDKFHKVAVDRWVVILPAPPVPTGRVGMRRHA
jgi:hypothetical protein